MCSALSVSEILSTDCSPFLLERPTKPVQPLPDDEIGVLPRDTRSAATDQMKIGG